MTGFSSASQRSLDRANVRSAQGFKFMVHRLEQKLAVLAQPRCRRNRFNKHPFGRSWSRPPRRLWVVPTAMGFGRQPSRAMAEFF